MTIELAQIKPSTVSGMRWAVHPVSPCARTRSYACSMDTVAALHSHPDDGSGG